jgi:adenylyltransferase/sulfurtransferase
MPLSKQDNKRYSRQIILSNIGSHGQERLLESKMTVIGLGALGTNIANNLARAGVGNIKIVDRDVVELENLHRQTLYNEPMLGKPKAIAAAEALKLVNPDIEITSIVKDVNFGTIDLIIGDSDVILDGTDNLETRFLINDYAVKKKIPWVYGGVVGTQGMSMTINPAGKFTGPCFRCMVGEEPQPGTLPTCDTYGILNTVPAIIGAVQSTEAFKIILGNKELNKKLLYYDVWTHEFRALDIPKNKACKCCAKNDYEYLNVKKRTMVTSLCGQNSVQILPVKSGEIQLDKFEKKLKRVGRVKRTEFTLEFLVDKYVITIFPDGRALIKGTTDDNLAKSLYTKYIGN